MAEGAPLLRVYRGNSIEGSNPSLTAISLYSLQIFRMFYCCNDTTLNKFKSAYKPTNPPKFRVLPFN